MTKYREILRLYGQGISSRNIAASLECSRNTIRAVITRAEEEGITWPLPDSITDRVLKQTLFGKQVTNSKYKIPDLEYIHQELAKSGVTLTLLWKEYFENCRLGNTRPLMYSGFCYQYQQFASKYKATLHVEHKPGERMEVDWAGDTASLKDNITGKPIPVYVFVTVLPCSGYAYAEGFLNRNQESWITAHIHAYEFFGGVARLLIPDNLKTGVEKANWYNPLLNKTYQEMAEHYGTVVIPTGVRQPKQKASVERAVGILSTWIIAALRNWQFFSLWELNEAMWQKLADFNHKPFQKKPGCRESAFAEERPFLLPLPPKPFELATWKIATVQLNYHIAVDKINYSVPYEYIKHKVDVRLTQNMIEVFYNGNRITCHKRLYGRPGQYSTIIEHMPENHRQYAQWNAERFITWSSGIGPFTEKVVKAIIASRKVEQQSYKTCIAILKLADTYTAVRLEGACEKAFCFNSCPSFRSIKTILKTGTDTRPKEPLVDGGGNNTQQYAFTRGKAYFGGKHDGE
ncbi:MAG: IS21 family transposase [Treponema sp.]|nr:IS21 family transposase [Treponema sp.]